MNRVERVRVLAWSLYDLTPLPETATGKMLRRSVLRGWSPSERIECPECGGYGHTTDRFKRRKPCELCGAKGRVSVDGYDREQRVRGTEQTGTVTRTKSSTCDRCAGSGVWKHARCEPCDGSGRREYSPFELNVTEAADGVVDVLERAIERRDESGSYHELEQRITGIVKHVNKPDPFKPLRGDVARRARDLYVAVYVGSLTEANVPLESLSTFDQRLVELAEAYIVWSMPAEIRVSPAVVYAYEHRNDPNRRKPRANGAYYDRRDETILCRFELGESVPSLANAYGLTDDGLKKALSRARAARDRVRRLERKTA